MSLSLCSLIPNLCLEQAYLKMTLHCYQIFFYIILFCIALQCYYILFSTIVNIFFLVLFLLKASFFGCLEKTQPVFISSNLTIETLKQGVKYV